MINEDDLNNDDHAPVFVEYDGVEIIKDQKELFMNYNNT